MKWQLPTQLSTPCFQGDWDRAGLALTPSLQAGGVSSSCSVTRRSPSNAGWGIVLPLTTSHCSTLFPQLIRNKRITSYLWLTPWRVSDRICGINIHQHVSFLSGSVKSFSYHPQLYITVTTHGLLGMLGELDSEPSEPLSFKLKDERTWLALLIEVQFTNSITQDLYIFSLWVLTNTDVYVTTASPKMQTVSITTEIFFVTAPPGPPCTDLYPTAFPEKDSDQMLFSLGFFLLTQRFWDWPTLLGEVRELLSHAEPSSNVWIYNNCSCGLGALASFMHKAVVGILSGSLLVDVHFQVFG